ncbi:MAG: type II toxin-antitoxin system VapC family toxin [Cyclobacteriaceae bacterium]
MSTLLLDTNAFSGLLRGDQHVFDVLMHASSVYMSVVVLGELMSGYKGGTKEQKNLETLSTFLKKPRVEILNVTHETAVLFATVKNQLRKDGLPIPINDVWIACHGLEKEAIIVTYDQHFRHVKGLLLWDQLKSH